MRRFAASLLTGLLTMTTAVPVSFAKTYNTQCIQTAIEKQEGVFISAFDAYYATVRSAMIVRKDALKNAWIITDTAQRRDAIRLAQKNFATTEKSARKARRDAEKAAAKTFKNEAKLCEIAS
jgi:hypothetical protein